MTVFQNIIRQNPMLNEAQTPCYYNNKKKSCGAAESGKKWRDERENVRRAAAYTIPQ